MSTNNFGRYNNLTENVEPIDHSLDKPMVATSDPYDSNELKQDAALVDEWPVAEKPAPTIPMDGTIIQETPRGETILYKDNVGTSLLPSTLEQLTQEAAIAPMTNTSIAPLLADQESEHFRTRWNEVQGEFVDDPRAAVQKADALVSEVVGQITRMFTDERSTLEGQWKQGSDVSTEDLRKALQHYRSFFNRLVV